MVMPFGLTNTSVSFEEIMGTIFKDMEGCIQYLNHIVIYGSSVKAEQQAIVKKVLQQCVEHVPAVNLLKSESHIHKTIFLVHIINNQKVKMDLSKLKTIFKWPIHTKKKKVQAFLGFANYYCLFIFNYSAEGRTLIHFTKDVPFT